MLYRIVPVIIFAIVVLFVLSTADIYVYAGEYTPNIESRANDYLKEREEVVLNSVISDKAAMKILD